jgi:pyruvate formate lyase activating enzyme
MKQARYWISLEGGTIQCVLCPHRCTIRDGTTGVCGVRKNEGGALVSSVWGLSVAASVDPIEKKPLYHLMPGSLSFSIATVGCNMRCAFCQNSDISQYPAHAGCVAGETLPPEQVVEAALDRGCSSVSYTYTEPTVFMEYMVDTARIARQAGLLNVAVTNGYTSPDVIRDDLAGLIDGANIDLKSFSDGFYRRLCSARLAPVLDAIQAYYESGTWIEITTLIIPGENDSPDELRETARFIRSLSPDIPWHISRYYPRYRHHGAGPTPVESLEEAREIGLGEGLLYVYTGNVAGHAGEHTFCPSCGQQVITRRGFFVEKKAMQGGSCSRCGQNIPGRFP